MKKAFTLIELLVVIGILALLAALIVPTLYGAKERAREAKARAEIKLLETAFKSYLDTYKTWPVKFTDGEINEDTFRTMQGENIDGMNPQMISFYEFPATTNANDAIDPWGKLYWVKFDKDYDNTIFIPDTANILKRSVVLWSSGPNRENDWGEFYQHPVTHEILKDDIASWR